MVVFVNNYETTTFRQSRKNDFRVRTRSKPGCDDFADARGIERENLCAQKRDEPIATFNACPLCSVTASAECVSIERMVCGASKMQHLRKTFSTRSTEQESQRLR